MPLRQCEWVVYAKRPFAGPEAVLAYLSRYTHRVAISNSRLVALDDRGVTFRWKDYRAEGRTRYKTMTLQTEEFMRRFLLHVLPSGFHRIRHYGLLANAHRKAQHPHRARATASAAARACRRTRATAAPNRLCPGPPSCAGTAARRCSSSRPSLALSTSADRRARRAHHDRHRVNQRNFTGGIFLNDADANTRGRVLQNVRIVATTLHISHPRYHRVPRHAIDTHRSSRRDNRSLHIGLCQPSNPHSASPPLILSSTSPRFPPSRIVQPLPIKLCELG